MEQGVDGGYDAGYAACDCFWGPEPGSLVREHLGGRDLTGAHVLDLGCGEGKNAAYVASLGAHVDAVDCSSLAIANGRRRWSDKPVRWVVSDASSYLARSKDQYDFIVMYGLLHCLAERAAVRTVLSQAKRATRSDGMHIVCAFNDRSQDLEAAHPGFKPLLLSHDYYVTAYSDWTLITASDSDLQESHPDTNIPHHHSLSRIVAHAV